MEGLSVQRGGRSGTASFANYMDHKDGLAVTKRQSIFSNSIEKSDVGNRGEICPCRHCRRQCKFFASGANFSIFTHFLSFYY